MEAWSRGQKANMPEWYERVSVAREMKWTYPELLDCPVEFYNDILRAMQTEAAFLRTKENG